MLPAFSVTDVRRTHPAQPVEWEGLTRDGRGIYARYGGGELTVYLGDPEDGPELAEANGRLLLLKVVALDDASAGEMTFTDLRRHTEGFIAWPTRETDAEREGE